MGGDSIGNIRHNNAGSVLKTTNINNHSFELAHTIYYEVGHFLPETIVR